MKTLADFAVLADSIVADWSSGEAALAACARLVKDVAASDVIRREIAGELAAIAFEPARVPQRSAAAHLWVLWGSARGARLAISRVPDGERDDDDYLADSPSHRFITPLDGAPLELALYEQRAAQDVEVMSLDDELTPRGALALSPGDVLTVHPRRDVLEVPPQATSRYLLVFEGPRLLTQQWIYDKGTRKPISSVAADPHDARLEGAMRFLRLLGHTEAAGVVASLASHPTHFVRWSAIRHAVALDPTRGAALLERAARDAHPHVRSAARRALEKLAFAAPSALAPEPAGKRGLGADE